MIARAAMLCLLLSATARAGDTPAISGLWIHHDAWQIEPAGINDGGNVYKSANAAIVHFCPMGELRIATGVLYQSTRSDTAQIGDSDGFVRYRGWWTKSPDGVSITYRIFAAEFRDLVDDPVASAAHSGELKFTGNRLSFPFTTIFGKTWQLTLTPAARYEKKLRDWKVNCSPKPH